MTARRLARACVAAAAAGLVASCALAPTPVTQQTKEYFSSKKYGPASPRVATTSVVPKGGGYYMIGEPYRVAGKTYIPRDNSRYAAVGLASWYGSAFHGRLTANGEVYDVNGLTAAHPTLPLPSYVRVTNVANGRSLVVRVNDRGPFAHNRIIDVSAKVADMLDFKRAGTAKVKVDYIGPAQMDGRDARTLLASYRGPGVASRTQFAFAKPPAGSFVLASAPSPRLMPKRLPDDAFAPTPAATDPLVLMPAYAPTAASYDPLGPLIMQSGFVSSYAAADRMTPAQQAAAQLARPGLATALTRAAAKKAIEIGGPPAIVQVGTFSDRTNAERVAAELDRFGQTETRVRDGDGQTLLVVCILVDSGTSPDAVIAAAADLGLSGAFVLGH